MNQLDKWKTQSKKKFRNTISSSFSKLHVYMTMETYDKSMVVSSVGPSSSSSSWGSGVGSVSGARGTLE